MTEDLFIDHLARALAQPGHTIILATLDGQGGAATQVRCDRPQDLVVAARSLLSQAVDELEGSSYSSDRHLADQVQCALAELPDPDADEGDA